MAGGGLIGYFRRNLFWIAVSVAVSLALWTIVSTPQDPELTLSFTEVPVRITGLRKGFTVRASPSAAIRVTGPAEALTDLDENSLQPTVDTSTIGAGQHRLTVKVQIYDPRIRIEAINPPTVFVLVESALEKNIPVVVRSAGTVPFGYSSGEPTSAREQVMVRGPAIVVNRVDAVYAEIDLNNATTNISQMVNLVPVGSGLADPSPLEIIPGEVRVEVPVDQQLVYKTVPVAAGMTGQVALGYQVVGLMVDPASLTLVGQPGALANVDWVQIERVDVTAASGDLAVSTRAILESGIGLARPQPIIARVLISPIAGSTTLAVGPQVIEAPPGKALWVSPRQILVTVAGPLPTLRTLDASDIDVTVNASGFVTEALVIKPDIKLPATLTLITASPSSIVLRVASSQRIKAVPVTFELIGSVADGYQVIGVVVEPSNVTLIGESSVLDAMISLVAEPIDISGRNSAFEMTVDLDLSQDIEVMNDRKVLIKLMIEPVEGTKRFTTPIVVTGTNSRYTVQVHPEEINVTIAGPVLALREIDLNELVTRIDTSGLSPGEYSLRPLVRIPQTVTIRAVEPGEVSVLIR